MATVLTENQIENQIGMFRLLALKDALDYEAKGRGYKGRNVMSIVKAELGLRGRGNRAKIQAQLQAVLDAMASFSEASAACAAIRRLGDALVSQHADVCQCTVHVERAQPHSSQAQLQAVIPGAMFRCRPTMEPSIIIGNKRGNIPN